VDEVSKAPTPEFSAPVPIDPSHNLSGFDCGKPLLDDWLRHRGLGNEGRFSRSYVVTAGSTVAGYYSIAAGAVVHDGAPPKLKRNAPDPIPTIVLGRLAVDRQFQGFGLGASLLHDALQRSLAISQAIGARAVIVHAIDPEAAAFYAAYEFQAFPQSALTLFLTIEKIAKAL
jgi:GNAT superfamily N-acetyltransferase